MKSRFNFALNLGFQIRPLLFVLLPVVAAFAAPVALQAQTVTFDCAIRTLASGFNNPYNVAVDGSGNVFVADAVNNAVKEIVAAGGYTTVNTLGSGFSNPEGVAVDGSGNVFVGDSGNNAVKEIVAVNGSIPPSPTINTLGSGFNLPRGVAVDGRGNVFVVDGSVFVADGAVKEIVAVNGSIPPSPTIKTLSSGFNGPFGVAVDASGNVFVGDSSNNAVKEIVAAGGYTTINTLGSGFSLPTGVAVDGSGNLFVADYGNNVVKEIAASGNFGPMKVRSASASPLTLYFIFDTGGTLGSTTVLTQGAAGLDFTDAGGGTCTASTAYNAGDTCTVNVRFKPTVPGPRYGAAELLDGGGDLLATGYVEGTGVGPLVNFMPGTQSALGGSGFSLPEGVAVDASGNVFVGDSGNNAVKEIVAAGGYTTVKTLSSGFSRPAGVAVDGSGNVFVADTFNNAVKEILAAGGYTAVNTLGGGFSNPYGVAVDVSGNVFVGDTFNNAVKEILAAGGYTTVKTLGNGFSYPEGVAVDGTGNVFVADYGNNAVKEIVAASGYTTVKTLGSGFDRPASVAVDGTGNVFVADAFNSAVKEIVAAGGYTTVKTLGSGFSNPYSVAVDGSGNVFVADTNNNAVKKLDYADPPSLSFASTSVGSTSSDSPQSVTVENIGNASLDATSPGLSVGGNFEQATGPGTPADCTSSFSLAPGGACNLSISFAPTMDGSISSSVVLTDNSLNGNPAKQTIPLSGTGNLASQTITFNAIASQVVGSSLTLSASSSSGLAVSFASLTTSVCTVSGTSAVFVTTGTCTIQASQSGNATYTAATPVSQSFSVIQKSQTITFNTVASQVVGGSLMLSASASSGLAVSFASLTTSVCTVSGTSAVFVATGTCTIQASQSGNATYAAATPVSQSFTVSPGTNFTITPIPAEETVKRGLVGAFILELKSVNGFDANVKLSCQGGPAGSKCLDFPQVVKVHGTAYAFSGVLFPEKTPPGTYTMTFDGVSGSINNTATAKFTVK